MAHLRPRFASSLIKKYMKFWPVVGLLGPRQCGKSTLFRELLSMPEPISFDDQELRNEVKSSPKAFLSRYELPLLIDEAQKAPEIFDEIKRRVDLKRTPGSFFLTGSARFSSKKEINESLTGRIGTIRLFPFTLAEVFQKEIKPSWSFIENQKTRFSIDQVVKVMHRGGMPIAVFSRDPEQRKMYWKQWLETTLYRDLALVMGRSYDADRAFSILNRMGDILNEGELPTLKHFNESSVLLRKYFQGMEQIFLIKKISCHPSGTGRECWMLFDSGLANYLMRGQKGEGAALSIARHFIWNEWNAHREYTQTEISNTYFKTAQGSPVDWIDGKVGYRIVASEADLHKRQSWLERPLVGAMKKLNLERCFLVAPIESAHIPKAKKTVGVLPWAWFS